MSIRGFGLASVMASVVIVGIFSPSHSAQGDRRTRSTLHEHTANLTDDCGQVLKKLMSTAEVEDAVLPKDSKWLITIRIFPPFAQKEASLSLRSLYDSSSEGSLISPADTSFYNQCVALKAKNPGASADEYLRQIAVRREIVNSRTLPELDKFASKIESISLSAVMPDELYDDATRYEIWSQSQYGQRIEIIMAGPGSDSKKQPSALLHWVEDYRKLLENYQKNRMPSK